MPDLDLDLETMRKAADEIDAAKDEVQALLDQFNGALQQYADAFGGDTIGSLVGAAHQMVADALTECLTTNIDEIAEYAQAAREMGDDHQSADDDMTPFLWDERLQAFDAGGRQVAWVQAVPISDGELDLALRTSVDRMTDLLQESGADPTDLARPSAV